MSLFGNERKRFIFQKYFFYIKIRIFLHFDLQTVVRKFKLGNIFEQLQFSLCHIFDPHLIVNVIIQLEIEVCLMKTNITQRRQIFCYIYISLLQRKTYQAKLTVI
jgi:hypothetical protein